MSTDRTVSRNLIKPDVSRVLNNESGVSERTRERVEAVMNQHGFSPSRSARAMRGQSD
ncbi:LacI family DNA-binding transcriptional regulator, partial [Salmonella enterica subsp. enterica serovar Kentucky]|nr:LacI family DNA-binding transcriptional regulator [Salmonella enterica subsp. enterica serovar Kentucky]